jgi:hypothetical protein
VCSFLPCMSYVFLCLGAVCLNIKFYFKLVKTALETHETLKAVYGNKTVSCIFVVTSSQD